MFDSHAVRDEIILRLSDSSYEESVASQLSDALVRKTDVVVQQTTIRIYVSTSASDKVHIDSM